MKVLYQLTQFIAFVYLSLTCIETKLNSQHQYKVVDSQKSGLGNLEMMSDTFQSDMHEIKQDFGRHNIFLQPEEKYVLVPASLFGSQSSFKKQYQLEIVQSQSKTINHAIKPNNKCKSYSTQQQQEPQLQLYEIHPALQKLNSYNLTAVKGLNVTDCSLLEVYLQEDDTPYIVCLRKSRQLQVHRIDMFDIEFQFSFRVQYLWNRMNIVSTTQIFFYNISNMQFYTYNKETNVLTSKEYQVQESITIQECETYIEDTASEFTNNLREQKLYQICYTNNNQISKANNIFQSLNLNEIKKEYVIMYLIDSLNIKQLNQFDIPQRNASSFSHIVGFDIVDSMEKVIMMCYNLYKISQTQKVSDKNRIVSDGINLKPESQTQFVSSYCSILKIYLENNQMVLINRMQLQQSLFPLLQTSLQINVMLTVATQVSVTFYHLDVLKQMFQYLQKIYIPTTQNFNCYELSRLSNSYDSVSLTCAKNQQETTTVSFVMVFDEDLGLYVPVGNAFVGVDFFHSAQIIFVLNQKELTVLKANQQYAMFDYSVDKLEIRVYEVDVDKPDDKDKYATIIVNPAQYGGVYVDEVLPLVQEINYDVSLQINLRGAFQGSNISYLKVQAVDQAGKPLQNSSQMIKNDRIYFYEFSLLVSVYIKEECIRVIKITDVSFYRILKIEKSRVDDPALANQNEQSEDQHYYYTETCNKLQESYVCELTEVHSSPQIKKQSSLDEQPDVIRVQSTVKHKVIDIEYLPDQDTFIYLYALQNEQKIKGQLSKTYGLMFVDMHKSDSNDSNLECYDLMNLIKRLFTSFVSLDLPQPFNPILTVQMQNDWLIISSEHGQYKKNVFCLLTNVKTYLLKDDKQPNNIDLKHSCIYSSTNQNNTTFRYFIQEDNLILSQKTVDLQKNKITSKITIFQVFKSQSIINKGSYYLVEDYLLRQSIDQINDQFIGLYRKYIIIINSTTISKFYLQVDLELVYRFTFNPQFVDRSDDESLSTGNSYPIKYVLFLEKYLIVQFEQFYQLYNIGEQLISIQIASNNFKTYMQSLNTQQRNKYGSLRDINSASSVIINDAFLIEGDNIMIYEKDHLVVAKYVTNPTLQLGPFDESHLVVTTNLQVRLKPILDVFNFQEVYQQVMFKIFYSHYVVQKIAKNIKTLTVPSVTSSYELEIWTNVFRGPVIQYYLSDTFDGQIVLKQHLTQIQDKLTAYSLLDTPFSIVQYHRPFGGNHGIKSNTTHLSIENKTTKQIQFVSIPDQLKNTFFLKFLQAKVENNLSLICILTIDQIVFLKVQSGLNQANNTQKYLFWTVFNHNISIVQNAQNPIPSAQIEILIKNQSHLLNRKTESEDIDFTLVLRLSNEQEKQFEVETVKLHSCNLHVFSFSLNQSKTQIQLEAYEKISLNEQIFKIRTLDFMQQKKDELFVLTYLQNVVIFKLSEDKSNSLIQIKQKIGLKDNIPVQYRSNQKYIAFQIFGFSHNQNNGDNQQLLPNLTMLLFAQSDRAFHIEFEVFMIKDQQQKFSYQLHLTNIYASYQSSNFVEVVEIGFSSNEDVKNNTIKPPYLYFVALYEYETSQSDYLIYYGYNYNFSTNKQAGYFKCGEELSKSTKSRHSQNTLNSQTKALSLYQEEPDNEVYYFYSINSNGYIEVQSLNITLKNDTIQQKLYFTYEVKALYDKIFEVNTTIYMYLNYAKPPIVTYILLNARNFNARAGIYTKFIFMKEQKTWMAFYITAPIILIAFVFFGWILKKHQPKETYRRKNQSKTQEIIFSDESRSSTKKQEKIIHIDSEEDSTSNNGQTYEDEDYSPRFGYVPPGKYLKHKQSSVLESPFKSYHEQNCLEDLSESDIGHSEEIKHQDMGHGDQHEEDKQILSYLLDKKSKNKHNKNSFS